MIGPAEIEDLLSDHVEALKQAGMAVPRGGLTWPITACCGLAQPSIPKRARDRCAKDKSVKAG
jgi:hypothetical protein